ncbi:integumentary mucin A.1-like [Ostrea edulis]|uniref:integumentary mucin A.1-like n=1 Tax=Ostrea edulis TaxID=37623 RepID=UPI0024AFB477|nr:integumentary mucin A.1-like [Ostrea edulis]
MGTLTVKTPRYDVISRERNTYYVLAIVSSLTGSCPSNNEFNQIINSPYNFACIYCINGGCGSSVLMDVKSPASDACTASLRIVTTPQLVTMSNRCPAVITFMIASENTDMSTTTIVDNTILDINAEMGFVEKHPKTTDAPTTEKVEVQTTPKVVEEPTTPKVVEEPTTPKVVEEPTTPKVVEEPTTPKVVEEPTTSKVVEEPTTPKVVEVKEVPTTPEVVEEIVTVANVDDQPTVAPKTVTVVKDNDTVANATDAEKVNESTTPLLNATQDSHAEAIETPIVTETVVPETVAPETVAPETISPEPLAPEPLAPEPIDTEESTINPKFRR